LPENYYEMLKPTQME